jgi:hypothetical protein
MTFPTPVLSAPTAAADDETKHLRTYQAALDAFREAFEARGDDPGAGWKQHTVRFLKEAGDCWKTLVEKFPTAMDGFLDQSPHSSLLSLELLTRAFLAFGDESVLKILKRLPGGLPATLPPHEIALEQHVFIVRLFDTVEPERQAWEQATRQQAREEANTWRRMPEAQGTRPPMTRL